MRTPREASSARNDRISRMCAVELSLPHCSNRGVSPPRKATNVVHGTDFQATPGRLRCSRRRTRCAPTP